MKNILDKKDFTYWIIILVLFIIGLATTKCAENDTILNYISFAGTITSILLALIAIIYSFVQNFTNVTLNQKLIDTADKIETATQKVNSSLSGIDDAATKLENVSVSVANATTNIDKSSENIKKISEKIDETMEGFTKSSDEVFLRFECVTSEIQETMNERLESANSGILNVSKQISELREMSQKSQSSNIISDTSSSLINEEYINNFVDSSSTMGATAIFLFIKLFKMGIKRIEIINALRHVFNDDYDYAYGYIVATTSTGLISYYNDNDAEDVTIIIQDINSHFIEKIESKITKSPKDTKEKEQLKKINSYVKSKTKLSK